MNDIEFIEIFFFYSFLVGFPFPASSVSHKQERKRENSKLFCGKFTLRRPKNDMQFTKSLINFHKYEGKECLEHSTQTIEMTRKSECVGGVVVVPVGEIYFFSTPIKMMYAIAILPRRI